MKKHSKDFTHARTQTHTHTHTHTEYKLTSLTH